MKAHPHHDPGTKDGRNVAEDVGELSGEGAQQKVTEPPRQNYPTTQETEHRIPHVDTRIDKSPTYYDQPVIKEQVWKPWIATYFYVGGLAGSAAMLGASAQLMGRGQLRGLIKRCQWIGAVGSVASAGLLIQDLGVRRRFIYMLRVFRPTSPMNVGTWILSSFGATAGAAALFDGLPGSLGRWGRRAGLAAGVFGGPLTTYTAVLIANTAVPVWQGSRRTLPLLFAASGATSAASALDLMSLSSAEARVVRRFGVLAKAAELVAAEAVTRVLEPQPRGADPLRHGVSGALWTAAKWSVAASLALSVLPGESRRRRRLRGWLGTIGSLATRLAIYRAGIPSARDPRATFEAQRAGFGGKEVTGQHAVADPPHVGTPVLTG